MPESEKTQKSLDFQNKHLGSVKSVQESSGSRKKVINSAGLGLGGKNKKSKLLRFYTNVGSFT